MPPPSNCGTKDANHEDRSGVVVRTVPVGVYDAKRVALLKMQRTALTRAAPYEAFDRHHKKRKKRKISENVP